jgi:hypothetical protein
MLVDLQTDQFTDSTGTGVELLLGADPSPAPCADAEDTICGRHLDGNGRFGRADGAHGALVGRLDERGIMTSSRGTTTVQMAFAGSAVASLDLHAARVDVEFASDDRIASLVISGAIPIAQATERSVAAFHVATGELVGRDCGADVPDACGCPKESTGATIIGLFDEDDNCAIALDEIATSSLVVSLLAPDIKLPDGSEALSFGFQATAIRVEVQP